MWKTEIKEKGQVGHERRKSLKIASVTSCIIVTASGLFVLFLFVFFLIQHMRVLAKSGVLWKEDVINKESYFKNWG